MFHKYPEIENTYRNKYIDKFVKHNPKSRKNRYIYQVKYDGSNISLLFNPSEEMRIAKRSGLIGGDENFHGVLDVIDNYKEIINYFQKEANENNIEIQVYGELYGKGIQNRINYGESKYIRFFDIRVNGEMLSYSEVMDGFPEVKDYYVETFGPITFREIFNLEPPEEHEGYVIKPYERLEPTERQLRLKLKNPKFAEKGKSHKQKKDKPKDPEVEKLKELFMPYINKNRVMSVFSKEGEIEEPEQIGNYIKLVMEDAKNDFEKENDMEGIDRNKLNQVFKEANREIVSILKEFL